MKEIYSYIPENIENGKNFHLNTFLEENNIDRNNPEIAEKIANFEASLQKQKKLTRDLLLTMLAYHGISAIYRPKSTNTTQEKKIQNADVEDKKIQKPAKSATENVAKKPKTTTETISQPIIQKKAEIKQDLEARSDKEKIAENNKPFTVEEVQTAFERINYQLKNNENNNFLSTEQRLVKKYMLGFDINTNTVYIHLNDDTRQLANKLQSSKRVISEFSIDGKVYHNSKFVFLNTPPTEEFTIERSKGVLQPAVTIHNGFSKQQPFVRPDHFGQIPIYQEPAITKQKSGINVSQQTRLLDEYRQNEWKRQEAIVKYGGKEAVIKRYHELNSIIKNSDYNQLLDRTQPTGLPRYWNEKSYYEEQKQILQKYLDDNPDIKIAVEEKEYLTEIFDYGFFNKPVLQSNMHDGKMDSSQDVDYSDGNWHAHPDPNISGVQIRHSWNIQEARSMGSVIMEQSGGSNKKQYLNCIGPDC